jgi:hypothetical protein
MSALPHLSDVDLFSHGESVVDFDSEIANRALDFDALRQTGRAAVALLQGVAVIAA